MSNSSPFLIAAISNIPFILPAIIGNALILVSFARNPSLLSPSNVLLIGLALSDLFIALLVQPLYIIKAFYLYAPASTRGSMEILNTLVIFFTTILCGVSFQTVTLIAIDRFLAIHLHLRYHEFVTVARVSGLLGIVWACNGIAEYFLLDFRRLHYYDYIGAPFTYLFLVINALLYFKVYRVVRRHQQQITDQLHSRSTEHNVNMVRFRKTFVGMFYVYFVFLLSHVPYMAAIAAIASSAPNISDSLRLLYEISFTIVYVNSSLNPFLFTWKLSNIRAAVKRTVCDAFDVVFCKQ